MNQNSSTSFSFCLNRYSYMRNNPLRMEEEAIEKATFQHLFGLPLVRRGEEAKSKRCYTTEVEIFGNAFIFFASFPRDGKGSHQSLACYEQ